MFDVSLIFFFISIDTKKKKKHWKILEKVSTEALPTFFLCGHKFVVIATTNAFDDASTFLPTKVKKNVGTNEFLHTQRMSAKSSFFQCDNFCGEKLHFYSHMMHQHRYLSAHTTTFVDRNQFLPTNEMSS